MSDPLRPTLAGWLSDSTPRPRSTTVVPHLEPELGPGDRVGPYRIIRLLGSGGMAHVFAAEHPELDRPVALKVARGHDDRCASFARLALEAEILGQLRHAAVSRRYDSGVLPSGAPWFAMELIDGETLASRLARGPLDLAYGCRLLAQLASALRNALQHGVVHRDLKPDNVILESGADGRCRLIDWGIARVPAHVGPRHTEVGLTAGTPGYMAPEQARGHEVDWRSDVYSLGVVAYEMFCGRPLFEAATSIDLMVLHLSEPPPSPRALCPDLPPALEHLILSMLAKTPAERPRLVDLEIQLRALGRQLGVPEVDIEIEYEVELEPELEPELEEENLAATSPALRAIPALVQAAAHVG